jgi:hypothetical protein
MDLKDPDPSTELDLEINMALKHRHRRSTVHGSRRRRSVSTLKAHKKYFCCIIDRYPSWVLHSGLAMAAYCAVGGGCMGDCSMLLGSEAI